MSSITDIDILRADANKYFGSVTDWIFDLDNTLYPCQSNLFAQIDKNMTHYVSNLFSLDFDAARLKQKDLYRRHGTTLRGLMVEHNIDSDDYLEKVHDIDYSCLSPSPILDTLISSLPGRHHIFSNADKGHVHRVLSRLGITQDFDTIFCISAAGLIPKPDSAAYDSFLEATGVNPEHSAFFEDMPRNLDVPQSLGMRTILVTGESQSSFRRESWEESLDSEPDFITPDITVFLKTLVDSL